MNSNKRRGRLHIAAVTTMIILTPLAWGCSSPTETQSSSPSGQPVSAAVAPAAKPGMKIGENNPAPGQPNHMSPEMQARMQQYQSKAPSKK